MKITANLLISCLVSSNIGCLNDKANAEDFSVLHYGEIGDGVTDDSKVNFLCLCNIQQIKCDVLSSNFGFGI